MGTQRERAADGHTLHFAVGELVAPAVQERRQPEPLYQIADNSIHRRAGGASQLESIFEILSHRAAKQDRPLFDQRDTASQRRAGAFRHQRPAEENLTLGRSEEHTSELQSQSNLVCRLLLEKKKYMQSQPVEPHSS